MNEEGSIKKILRNCKTIAVVGLSRDPAKDSYRVTQFLQSKGHRIIPINPFVDHILGERCYKSLLEMPENLQKTIEIVSILGYL